MSRTAGTGKRLGRFASTRWGVMVLLAAVAGTALRVWVYRSSLGIPDSDEAVVGLMARHFAGGELATYFWGQAYGGSQEVLATVPLFWVAGSSWLTLRLVPIALSAVTAVVVWRVGRRTIGEPAAVVAGCVSWIWPPFVIYKLTHQWGFYASGTLYTGLLLLVTLRMVERPTARRVGVFGLVVGLALWQSTQLVPIVLPAILWAIWKQPAWLRRIWIAGLLAALGALPAIVWNARHGWGSLASPIEDTTTYQHRLRIFASPLMPMMLGLRTPFTQEPLLSAAVAGLVLACLVGLFAYGAYRARRREASILYVVAACFPLLYALAPATLFSQEPKYLVVLSPVLVLLVAQLASTYWRAAALVGVALVISVATLDRDPAQAGHVFPHGPGATSGRAARPRSADLHPRRPGGGSRLCGFLARVPAHVRHGRADHRRAEQVHRAAVRGRSGCGVPTPLHPVSALRDRSRGRSSRLRLLPRVDRSGC